jgi:stage II sporulation protein D
MIRTTVTALLLALFLVSPSYARKQQEPPTYDGKIKVLVMDQNFRRTPADGERLELLEKLKGNLVVGFSDYQGVIEVWRGQDGLYLINEIPLEAYVEGVVKAETGAEWAPEALKAQAVIVRTYVLKQVMRNLGKKYHVTSTVLHQVYKGLNSDPDVTEAVRETSGEVLTYEGEPIMAFYHSTGGGMTELPQEVFGRSYPYLTSVEADGRLSPLSVWARRIPLKDVAELTGTEKLTDIQITSRTATGRAKDMVLVSNPDQVAITAADLRKKLGWRRLPSTNFTVELEGDFAMFEGTGYGHGVGLCQWTSLEMARDGMTYGDILSYFYPGATIQDDEDLGF